MEHYRVIVKGNRVVGVEPLDAEDEEYLGIEWALSEAKDSFSHAKHIDGSYTLAGEEELGEFLGYVERLFGREALGGFGRL